MHSVKSKWRLPALIAVFVGAFVLFAGNFSPVNPPSALAAGDLTGVSCSDLYLDNPPLFVKGDPVHGDEDLLLSTSLTRTEPAQSGQPNAWDITTVSYLGPNFDDDLEGEEPPTKIPCNQKTLDAKTGAEKGQMNAFVNFVNQWTNRPTTANAKIVGAPGEEQLVYQTCSFSETTGAWIRVDVNAGIVTKGDQAKNIGHGVLYVATLSPTTPPDPTKPNEAVNPLECDPAGAIPFPFIIESHSRDATTDHPTVVSTEKNFGIATDPDGPNDPKMKGVDQLPDNDLLADDWDGDGCPDWDELDKNFNHDDTSVAQPDGYTGLNDLTIPMTKGDQNGMDPFNPNDCDSNYGGISHVIATATPNTFKCTVGQIATGNCTGPGASYFTCISNIEHIKTGKLQPLITTLQCYTNSTSVTVDFHGIAATGGDVGTCPPALAPPLPDARCGDGLKGRGGSLSYLAGPFLDIQPGELRTVLQGAGNYYDTNTNTLHTSGCFQNVKGLLGPNIFVQSRIDAHTGVGYVNIWTQRPDCVKPAKAPNAPLEFHAKVETTEQGGNQALVDTDHDGCTDATELNDAAGSQQNGGIRDPWNYWDFYDMDFDGSIGFGDFLEMLQHYGSDDAGGTAVVNRNSHPIKTPETPLLVYHPRFDRGNFIPGANGWNENAADGSIGFNDFLSLLRQYTHSCA